MRNRTLSFVAAATAALALAAIPAAAHARGRFGQGPGAGGPDHILRMAKTLDLTDQQKTEIEAIAAKQRGGALGDSAAAMRTARQALAGAIHDISATDDQVRDAAAAVAALEAQVAVQRHQMAIQILSVLTPEQQTKLENLRANFREQHAGRRFRHPSEN